MAKKSVKNGDVFAPSRAVKTLSFTAAGCGSRGRRAGSSKVVAASSSAIRLTHDLIAGRAYFIWQNGGGDNPVRNWTEAERQLKTELGL